MAIGEAVPAAYPRHMATGDRVALPIGMAVIAVAMPKAIEVIELPVVVNEAVRIVGMVADRHRMRVGRLGHVARRIMGMVRAEGNNITRRKVCSTSQCEPDESCRRCVVVILRSLYARTRSPHSVISICV